MVHSFARNLLILKHGLSPRFFARILSNAYYSFVSGPKAPMPFMLKLENTTLCNLKCNMCPHGAPKGLRRQKGSLNFENFKYIYDQIKPCYLNLTGIGEPLLNKDIYDIIKYARKNRSCVKFDTNATLLTEENARKLLEAGPSILSISLDGMSAQTFEKIRVGADFNTVMRNIKYFASLKKELKSDTQLHLFMVVQKHNFHEFPDFLEFGNSIGADSVNATFVVKLGENLNESNKLQHEDLQKIEAVKKRALGMLKSAESKSMVDNLLGYLDALANKQASSNYNAGKPCYWPWYVGYVTWDGYVNPCHFFCENEYVVGNVFEEPFIKIWNNKGMQEFRKRLIEKREGICAACGFDETFLYDKFKIFHKLPLINKLSHRAR